LSLIDRLLGRPQDDRAAVRPLWHRVIEIAREKPWYAQYGVADTVAGRFDAVTMVLSLTMLRMERDEPLRQLAGRITELFVDDMDGQLRQSGVGDLVVGKRMGKLVSTLGGRIGVVREAMADADPAAALVPVLERNMTLIDNADTAGLAAAMLALFRQLEQTPADALLAGGIAR
jgi:cytochrome b pre-mRNA-processing protein 3